MRKHLWLAVATLLVGAGCPSEFGIEGRIDKAMERDMEMEKEEVDCPAGTNREKVDRSCKDEAPGTPPCKTTCVVSPPAVAK